MMAWGAYQKQSKMLTHKLLTTSHLLLMISLILSHLPENILLFLLSNLTFGFEMKLFLSLGAVFSP